MPVDKYQDLFFDQGRLMAVEFYTQGRQPQWADAPFNRKWQERGFYYQLYFLARPSAAPGAPVAESLASPAKE